MASAPGDALNEPLRVGLIGGPPMVMSQADGSYGGLSVELWRMLAAQDGLKATLIHTNGSGDTAIDGLVRGDYDVIVGPLSITAQRAQKVRFTQPYFQSAIGVVSQQGASSGWRHIFGIVSMRTFVIIGGFFFLLACVGGAVWLAERKTNPQFPRTPLEGIGSGLWFAIVTMTSLGYGDKAPITVAGRVISSLWTLTSLVATGSLVAFLASAFTLASLDTRGFEDGKALAGKAVASVKGTTAWEFARQNGGRMVEVPNLAGAIAVLEAGTAVAATFDRPTLRYWLNEHPQSTLELADAEFQPQGYGFAVMNYDLLRQLNVSLLQSQENGSLQDLVKRFFPQP